LATNPSNPKEFLMLYEDLYEDLHENLHEDLCEDLHEDLYENLYENLHDCFVVDIDCILCRVPIPC